MSVKIAQWPLNEDDYLKLGVDPLQKLSLAKQESIGRSVRQPKPPRKMTRGRLFQIVSRYWFEWHLARGHDPRARREKIPAHMREAVVLRDGMVCGICGDAIPDRWDLHIDHIVPLRLGGPTVLLNLQPAHSVCNLRKGGR